MPNFISLHHASIMGTIKAGTKLRAPPLAVLPQHEPPRCNLAISKSDSGSYSFHGSNDTARTDTPPPVQVSSYANAYSTDTARTYIPTGAGYTAPPTTLPAARNFEDTANMCRSLPFRPNSNIAMQDYPWFLFGTTTTHFLFSMYQHGTNP